MEVWDIYAEAVEEYKAKNFDAALRILDEIKKIAPAYKKAHMLEAYIWRDLENDVKIFDALNRLMPLLNPADPDQEGLISYSLSLFAGACRALGLAEESVKFAVMSAERFKDTHDSCDEQSNAIFAAALAENFSAADFQGLYDKYKKYLADIKPYPKKFYEHKKIRVGFLSGDFRVHPVIKWAWALLFKLDKNLFETYCYSSVGKYDVVTEYVNRNVDNWRDISSLDDAQAAQVIRNDAIDILFDLSGHTSGNRLRAAAYRPATIQISGVGFINSTGLDCFDYFLSDIYCAGNSEKYFTEKIIRLPHSHICFEPSEKLEIGGVPSLKKNFVTFGCFNQFGKITDTILFAWKRILDAVPNSRLILKNKILKSDDGKTFVRNRLKRLGLDVARIDLRGSSGNYLREYDDVDIALDTFPYTGGVTTCEALHMGVPVISLYGDKHGTRIGYSILKNVGLDELAVNSYDDYVSRAIALAGDRELLKILRKNLRGMMTKSALMNSELYIHDMEEVLIKIYRNVAKSTRCRKLSARISQFL